MNIYDIEGIDCDECGEGVGMVDLGDVDGAAAMGWRDFATHTRMTYDGPVVKIYHPECEPA